MATQLAGKKDIEKGHIIDERLKSSSQDHIERAEPNFVDDVEHHHHQLRQEWRIYSMALNACLGSWFFGYNLGVYNSAQKIIGKLNKWDDSDYEMYTALITAFMPLGALIGAYYSKQILEAIRGIRKSMLIFDIIAVIGTIVLLIDFNIVNLLIGRFICGFAIGTNTAIIPIYIKDFSPVEISGKAGSVNQVSLTVGLFCSYLISLVLPLPADTQDGYNDAGPWRIVLGLPMIAPVLRLIILMFIFRLETPTVMMKEHRYQEVKDFLKQIYYSEKDADEIFHNYEEVINEEEEKKQKKLITPQDLTSNGGNKNEHHNEITSNNDEIKDPNHKSQDKIKQINSNGSNQVNIQLATIPLETHQSQQIITQPHLKSQGDFYHSQIFELTNKASYTKRLFLGCIIQIGTQITGVNAILFYSNSIFKDITSGTVSETEQSARYATIGLGAAMAFYTFISFFIIDKFGRRTLMLFGMYIMLISLFVFAGLQKHERETSIDNFCIFLIFLFLLGWQLSMGAVIWVFNSEILDRYGISLSSFFRWLATMIIGLVFPYMKKGIYLFGSFLIFGGFSLALIIYFTIAIKETQGKDRYEILKQYCTDKKYKEFEKQAHEYANQQFEEQRLALKAH